MSKNQINEEKEITKSRLLDYIKKFSFPRLSGTEGEKKAVNLTIQTFKNLGYEDDQISLQKFKFSTFYSEELVKIIGFMNIIIIVILLFFKYIYPFLVLFTIIIIILSFLSMVKVLKHPELKGFWEKHFGKFIDSTNVFIKLPAKKSNLEEIGNILISAHLDSKSQTFKTEWRVAFFLIWEMGILIWIILYAGFLIDLYFNLFKSILLILEISLIVTSGLVIFSIIMIIIIKTDNKSPGAIDNASGMSIVFELSSYFKIKPLNHFNLWFCQFSAEEIGTMGSRVFLDKYKDEFIQNLTFQINFDMISYKNHREKIEYIKSYGILPKKKSSSTLLSYINDIAKEENLEVDGHTLLSGAHTDSVPFHLLKLQTIDFSTPLAAKFSHSIEDQPDKVEPEALVNTLNLVKKLVLKLDDSFSKLRFDL
ncbi:MAG: M28 family metallopeptidase [Promethearchaeota archaeon]